MNLFTKVQNEFIGCRVVRGPDWKWGTNMKKCLVYIKITQYFF